MIGIYSFFFSLALFHPTVGALDYCLSAHKMCVCVCVSQAIYYRYHVGVVLAMSGTRSGNVRPIMVLIVSYHRKLTEFSYKALVVPDIIHCSILLTVHLSLFTTSKWILFTLARILTSTTTRFVTNK